VGRSLDRRREVVAGVVIGGDPVREEVVESLTGARVPGRRQLDVDFRLGDGFRVVQVGERVGPGSGYGPRFGTVSQSS